MSLTTEPPARSRFIAIARRSVETNTVTLIVQIALVCMEATGTGGLWYRKLFASAMGSSRTADLVRRSCP